MGLVPKAVEVLPPGDGVVEVVVPEKRRVGKPRGISVARKRRELERVSSSLVEEDVHRKAFDVFYRASFSGASVTASVVMAAEAAGVPADVVRNWAIHFGWAQRAVDRSMDDADVGSAHLVKKKVLSYWKPDPQNPAVRKVADELLTVSAAKDLRGMVDSHKALKHRKAEAGADKGSRTGVMVNVIIKK